MYHLVVTDNPDFTITTSKQLLVKTFSQLDEVTDGACYRVEVPRFHEVKYEEFETICEKLCAKVRQDGYLYVSGYTSQCLTSSVLGNLQLATILEKTNFFHSPIYVRQFFMQLGLELDYHKHDPQQPYFYEIKLWQ